MKHFWTSEEIKLLKKLYPHFGKQYTASYLNLETKIVKAKADKLKLIKLPKDKRKCINNGCKRYQSKRIYGHYCKLCFYKKRTEKRKSPNVPISQRFNEMLRSIRYRSDICDIDLQYLLELWDKQQGKCFYSGLPMEFARWGQGRKEYSVSIDQKILGLGYTKENVVLCCWAANSGKGTLAVNSYIEFCKAVVKYNG